MESGGSTDSGGKRIYGENGIVAIPYSILI